MSKLIAAAGTVGRTQGPRLKALYGCMYYAMLRPSEAASLLLDECKLPDQGWGLLEFSEISTAAGRDWTDDGEVHQAGRPKGGPRNAVRRVPIPPVLVAMICEHVELHGTAPDGRLFRTASGGIYLPSTLWTVLQAARKLAFTRPQQASPAGPPALRLPARGHLLAAERRNAPPQVAEWAGHTVEVLLRTYAHCIDGDEDRWLGAMEAALGDD
jgi:integrase